MFANTSWAIGLLTWFSLGNACLIADELARHVIEPSSLFREGNASWHIVIDDSQNKVAFLRSGELEIRDLETRELVGTSWSLDDEQLQAEYQWLKSERGRITWSLFPAPHSQGLVLMGTNGSRSILLLFDSSVWDCTSEGPVQSWSLPKIAVRGVQCVQSTLIVWSNEGRGLGKIIRLDTATGDRQDVGIPFRIAECWGLGENGLGICSFAVPQIHQLGILANDEESISRRSAWGTVPANARISSNRPFTAMSTYSEAPFGTQPTAPIVAIDVHVGFASQRVRLPCLCNSIESAVWSNNGRWLAIGCIHHIHGDVRSSQSIVVFDTETWSKVQVSRPRALYASARKNEPANTEAVQGVSNDGRFVFSCRYATEDLSRQDIVYEFASDEEY